MKTALCLLLVLVICPIVDASGLRIGAAPQCADVTLTGRQARIPVTLVQDAGARVPAIRTLLFAARVTGGSIERKNDGSLKAKIHADRTIAETLTFSHSEGLPNGAFTLLVLRSPRDLREELGDGAGEVPIAELVLQMTSDVRDGEQLTLEFDESQAPVTLQSVAGPLNVANGKLRLMPGCATIRTGGGQ